MTAKNESEELSDLERKLKEGRELMLEVNKERGSANISVLSTPAGVENQAGAVSAKSSYSDGDEVDEAEVASKSNVQLLEETERLLSKMSEMNSFSQTNNNDEDNDMELNAMLDKAGQLSSMMQSISENISLNCGETPSLVRQSDQVLKEAGYKDDSCTSTGKSQYRQDPPGSHNSNDNNNSPSKEDRPASSVNVMQSMDDDVSSVGSASLRFTNYNAPNNIASNTPKTSRQLAASLEAEAEATEDDPFGESTNMFKRESSVPEFNSNNNSNNNEEKKDADAKQNSEAVPQAPPSPTNFSMASSPRDAAMTPYGVQWEKVTTAKEGEEDYVPLVDYSHIKVSYNPEKTTARSRWEQLRKRNAARRRRRMKIIVSLSVTALAGFAYVKYFSPSSGDGDSTDDAGILEEEEEVVEPLEAIDMLQSFDSSFLLGTEEDNDGVCFEAEEGGESLLFTLPKPMVAMEEAEPVVEEVVVEQKPRRGLFGRRQRMK